MNGMTCQVTVGVTPGERADGPEAELVERRLVEQRDRAGERAEQRRQRGPGEREAHRVGAAAAHRTERVHEHRRDRGADEGEPHEPEHVRDVEGPDREHDGERRAGVDPEQSRVGERVAGDALHQRAGHAERGADEHGQDRARQAQVADDEVVGDRRSKLGERVDTVPSGIDFDPTASDTTSPNVTVTVRTTTPIVRRVLVAWATRRPGTCDGSSGSSRKWSGWECFGS